MDDLKDIQAFSDEWLQLNNKLEMEKSSADRRIFTEKYYQEFLTNYYKKLRLIDPNNAFRFIRLGCSLQNITPIVEYIVMNI